jgi:hypothetical protein
MLTIHDKGLLYDGLVFYSKFPSFNVVLYTDTFHLYKETNIATYQTAILATGDHNFSNNLARVNSNIFPFNSKNKIKTKTSSLYAIDNSIHLETKDSILSWILEPDLGICTQYDKSCVVCVSALDTKDIVPDLDNYYTEIENFKFNSVELKRILNFFRRDEIVNIKTNSTNTVVQFSNERNTLKSTIVPLQAVQ